MEAALQHQTERMESALQAQRTSSGASVDLEQERDLLKTEIAALKEQQQAFNIEYTRRAKLAQEEQATAERDRVAAVAAAQSANEAIEQELESIRSRQQRRLANVVCMAKQAHATVMSASSANPRSLVPALQTALECHRVIELLYVHYPSNSLPAQQVMALQAHPLFPALLHPAICIIDAGLLSSLLYVSCLCCPGTPSPSANPSSLSHPTALAIF